LILKPRLLSEVTHALAKAVAARRRAQRPVDGVLSVAAARALRQAISLMAFNHRCGAEKGSVFRVAAMTCCTIGAPVETSVLSAWRCARRPRRVSWGRRNRDMVLAALAQRVLCLGLALDAPRRRAKHEPWRHFQRGLGWRADRNGGCDESHRARREAESAGTALPT
jgi:hypothetical protein